MCLRSGVADLPSIRRSAYLFPAVISLRSRDARLVLEFLSNAAELESAHPFDERLLALLREIIPSPVIAYGEMDRGLQSWTDGTTSSLVDERGSSEELYFALVHQCPTLAYRDRTGDQSATRISDVLSSRRWHDLELYRACFQPFGLDQVMEIWLPAPAGRDRVIAVWRERGSGDLSDRDRDVLNVLRPHLVRRQELASLRARLAGSAHDGLTKRERQILRHVAQGKTNAEVATELWVAESTVKKHLENVYAKLGVPGRAAAVARLYGTALS